MIPSLSSIPRISDCKDELKIDYLQAPKQPSIHYAASVKVGFLPTFAALAQTAQKGPFVERSLALSVRV
jgi:hypothetical protein